MTILNNRTLILFKLIGLNLRETKLFEFYEEIGYTFLDLQKDVIENFNDSFTLQSYLRIDLPFLINSNVSSVDIDLLNMEVNTLLWNVSYRVNNTKINNFKYKRFYVLDSTTIVLEYFKDKYAFKTESESLHIGLRR